MASDPSLEIQRLFVARLKANGDLAAIVGDKVFDRVPDNLEAPYVQIGEMQVLDDGYECGDGMEVFVDVHTWSKAYGSVECKRMTAAVRGALHDLENSAGSPYNLYVRHSQTRVMADPDGEHHHGITSLRVLADAT